MKDLEAVIINSKRQLNLETKLPDYTPVDIQLPSSGGELTLNLLKEDQDYHFDDFYHGYQENNIVQPTRIIRQNVGKYYYPFGLNNESAEAGLYQAIWQYRISSDFDYETEWQLIRVIPTSLLELISDMRLIVDKSLKYIDFKTPTPTKLGYSTGMLVKYLEMGLASINYTPPSPTWVCLEQFPRQYRSLLIKAATYWALTSQYLYAVDTDIPSWSDNGLAYVKQTSPQLFQLLTSLKDDIKTDVTRFKMQFVSIGSVTLQNIFSYRFNAVLQTIPHGSRIRGGIVAGF